MRSLLGFCSPLPFSSPCKMNVPHSWEEGLWQRGFLVQGPGFRVGAPGAAGSEPVTTARQNQRKMGPLCGEYLVGDSARADAGGTG